MSWLRLGAHRDSATEENNWAVGVCVGTISLRYTVICDLVDDRVRIIFRCLLVWLARPFSWREINAFVNTMAKLQHANLMYHNINFKLKIASRLRLFSKVRS